jgi:hypothetical protein
MVSYLIGFANGICVYKIFQIISIYRARKRCKSYVYKVSTPEELRNALGEIINDMIKEKKDG